MLSNKIAALRRQAGWSQEDLAERLDVSRQSVSKWESGASQPDVDKIVALSRLFGVSTDSLLRDDADMPVLVGIAPQDAPELRLVEDAEEDAPEVDENGLRLLAEGEVFRYLENRRRCAPMNALGAGLCVACPAPMMALMGLPLPAGLSVALGIALLLGMIAAAVAIFISARMNAQKYDYVEKTPFALTSSLREAVLEQKRQFQPAFRQSVIYGTVLCILSPVPVVMGGILNSKLLTLSGVGALLLMLAAGVFLFTRDGLINDGFDHLLKLAERSLRRVEREQRRRERNAA